ncbi:hypothetical protein [Salsuginibacillus kocurii]|uniref:hypothetical protein n=1 Tax=Salsuginibacillus kocurii TaxID=427078 RepID=UPI00036D0F61|nr:hypothetical protein [Salsuginibacillus kocurii]
MSYIKKHHLLWGVMLVLIALGVVSYQFYQTVDRQETEEQVRLAEDIFEHRQHVTLIDHHLAHALGASSHADRFEALVDTHTSLAALTKRLHNSPLLLEDPFEARLYWEEYILAGQRYLSYLFQKDDLKELSEEERDEIQQLREVAYLTADDLEEMGEFATESGKNGAKTMTGKWTLWLWSCLKILLR